MIYALHRCISQHLREYNLGPDNLMLGLKMATATWIRRFDKRENDEPADRLTGASDKAVFLRKPTIDKQVKSYQHSCPSLPFYLSWGNSIAWGVVKRNLVKSPMFAAEHLEGYCHFVAKGQYDLFNHQMLPKFSPESDQNIHFMIQIHNT